MLRSYDYAFVEAAFSSGPMACKTPGAVSAEHIAHFKQGLRQPNACTAALDYYRAFVDTATRFPSAAGVLLSRFATHNQPASDWGLTCMYQACGNALCYLAVQESRAVLAGTDVCHARAAAESNHAEENVIWCRGLLRRSCEPD